jgi:hypothetical protein
VKTPRASCLFLLDLNIGYRYRDDKRCNANQTVLADLLTTMHQRDVPKLPIYQLKHPV